MKLKSVTATLAATLALGSFAASADILVVNDALTVRQPAVAAPSRGMSMETVESKFGEPAQRHAAVGQPAITRWDYPGFSVFFENRTVLHTVATGA